MTGRNRASGAIRMTRISRTSRASRTDGRNRANGAIRMTRISRMRGASRMTGISRTSRASRLTGTSRFRLVSRDGKQFGKKIKKRKAGEGQKGKSVGDNSASGQVRRWKTGRGRRGAGAQTAVCGRAESQGFPLTGRTLAAIGFPKISWYRRKYSSNVSGVPKESNSICTPKRHTRKGSGVMPWRR